MIIPSFEEIRKVTDSRYGLVMLVSKRARKIVDGAAPLKETSLIKPVSIAIEEVIDADVVYGPKLSDEKYEQYIEEQKAKKLATMKEQMLEEIKLNPEVKKELLEERKKEKKKEDGEIDFNSDDDDDEN